MLSDAIREVTRVLQRADGRIFALLFVSKVEGVDQSCFLSAPNRRPTVRSLCGSRQIHRLEPNPNLTRWRARGMVRSRAYCLAFSSDGG
jgi:hypothetical protein